MGALVPSLVAICWLLAHGVSFSNSMFAVLVLIFQITTGAIIWRSLLKKEFVGNFEVLGMGFATGSAIAVISDQLLLETPLRNFSFLPSLVIATALTWKNRRQKSRLQETVLGDQGLGWSLAFVAVVIGGGSLEMSSLLTVVAMLALVGYRLSIPADQYVTGLNISTTFVALAGSLLIWVNRTNSEISSWILRPLYTGTDDHVFSEAISWSVANFGIHEMTPALGTELKYHWFSLAWSGLVGRTINADLFAMTLHIVPMVAFAVIASLVWSLVRRFSQSRTTVCAAILLIFATNSVPEPIRVFHTATTSNTLSFVWLLAGCISVHAFLNTSLKFSVFVISFFASVTLLSKAPYGAALGIGMCWLCVFLLLKGKKSKEQILPLVAALLSMALTYFVFLQPHSWEVREFVIQFNPLRLAIDSPFYPLLALGTMVAIFTSRLSGMTLVFRSTLEKQDRQFFLFLAGITSVAILSVVLNGNSAERYFLGVALVAGSILSALGIEFALARSLFDPKQRYAVPKTQIAISFAVSLSLAYLWHEQYGKGNNGVAGSNIGFFIPIAAAAVSLSIIYSVQLLRKGTLDRKQFWVNLSVGILAASIGVFGFTSTIKGRQGFETSIASETDVRALNWLRENSGDNDVVATNRLLCREGVDCGFDDSSYLISAISQRRVLVEGPRFVIGGRPYPQWMEERIELSLDFAESPTTDGMLRLAKKGVKWFYYDSTYLLDGQLGKAPLDDLVKIEYIDGPVMIFRIS